MTAALSAHELEGGYGAVQILHRLSMTVARGSVTTLVGANGAGKTTLMRVLAGLLPVRGGAIRFAERDITTASTAARVDAGLTLVPEGRLVFPTLTVEENLRLGAISPHARVGAGPRLQEMWSLFPRLIERRNQSAGSLSGGEQQMLAIARGLMAQPKVLLLDEPTLGLAPTMATLIFSTIDKLRARGLTVVLAEQDLRRALAIADHAYVIENGRVAIEGSGQSLIGDSRVRSAYLGISG